MIPFSIDCLYLAQFLHNIMAQIIFIRSTMSLLTLLSLLFSATAGLQDLTGIQNINFGCIDGRRLDFWNCWRKRWTNSWVLQSPSRHLSSNKKWTTYSIHISLWLDNNRRVRTRFFTLFPSITPSFLVNVEAIWCHPFHFMSYIQKNGCCMYLYFVLRKLPWLWKK